jgi:hypothetical protein
LELFQQNSQVCQLCCWYRITQCPLRRVLSLENSSLYCWPPNLNFKHHQFTPSYDSSLLYLTALISVMLLRAFRSTHHRGSCFWRRFFASNVVLATAARLESLV